MVNNKQQTHETNYKRSKISIVKYQLKLKHNIIIQLPTSLTQNINAHSYHSGVLDQLSFSIPKELYHTSKFVNSSLTKFSIGNL